MLRCESKAIFITKDWSIWLKPPNFDMILGNDYFNLFAKSNVSSADYIVSLIQCAAEVPTVCAPFFERLTMKRSACVILAN